MSALASKSGISPAIRHARPAGSNARMARTPDAPARSASQKAAGVDPIGLRTPRPVMTARRGCVAMVALPGRRDGQALLLEHRFRSSARSIPSVARIGINTSE